jgi:hypothetical protein
VGRRFQPFGINDLWMVGQTGIEPSPKGVSSDWLTAKSTPTVEETRLAGWSEIVPQIVP